MSSLTIRRGAVVRDLDAFISRLHSLNLSQWRLQTPDEGWEVRHLASHLVGTVAYLAGMLDNIVKPELPPTRTTAQNVTPDSSGEQIITSLTLNRNTLFATLAEMTEDDLGKVADSPTRMFTPTGELYLDMSVFEAGVHRYDLDYSVDRGSAGLDDTTVRSMDTMFGGNMVLFATGSETKPQAPVSFHFNGSLVQHYLTWDGKEWFDYPADHIPVTTIQGDDSALALFICGRIPASDHRLGIRGDRAAVERFKTFVPGP